MTTKIFFRKILQRNQCARCSLSLVLLWLCTSYALAQHSPIDLWSPGELDAKAASTKEIVRVTPQGDHVVSNIQRPSITPYFPLPELANGAAIIIAPGGGHSELWMDHEGYAVAEWLSNHGIAAFVLKYRLAKEARSKYTIEGTELHDLERAVRTVRSRSQEWHIDSLHIGVLGFSAGGELALLASTRYDGGSPIASDPIERISSKPDFQALIYPAIPLDTRLNAQTPPAFLACGGNDRADISQGLAELYLALTRLKVPTELHIYAGIGHGFGVRKTNSAAVADWTTQLLHWMNSQGLTRTR